MEFKRSAFEHQEKIKSSSYTVSSTILRYVRLEPGVIRVKGKARVRAKFKGLNILWPS